MVTIFFYPALPTDVLLSHHHRCRFFLPHQKLMPNSRIIIDSIFFSTNHWCPHFTINVDFFLPSIKCWYFYSQHQLLMPNSFFFFCYIQALLYLTDTLFDITLPSTTYLHSTIPFILRTFFSNQEGVIITCIGPFIKIF